MKHNLELLKQELKRNKTCSLSELKSSLNIDSDDALMTQILELLERELDGYNFNRDPSRHSFLFMCFNYLEYNSNKVNFIDPNMYENIVHRLNKAHDIIDAKLAHPCKPAKINTFNRNVDALVKLRQRVIEYCAKHEAKINEEHNLELYDIMHHLIFDVKNLAYLKEIFKELPDIKNTHNEFGKPLLQEIVEHYLTAIKNPDQSKEMSYFEKTINIFIRTYNDKEVLQEIKQQVILVSKQIACDDVLSELQKTQLISHMCQIADGFDHVKQAPPKLPYNRNTPRTKVEEYINFNTKIDLSKHADMVHKRIITIDNPSCRFREDAISIDQLKNGFYRLGMYITDVDSYIKPETKEDLIKFKELVTNNNRSLFPKQFLRNQLSLDKNKDRPVIAFEFIFNRDGEVVNYGATTAVIKVKENYKFSDVKKMMKNRHNDSDLVNHLFKLAGRLYRSNPDVYDPRGYLETNDYLSDPSGAGNFIVKMFSTFLNTFIASEFHNHNKPFVYRIDDLDEKEYLIEKIAESLGNTSESEKLITAIKNSPSPTRTSTDNTSHKNIIKGRVTGPGRMLDSLINQRQIKQYMIDKDIRKNFDVETELDKEAIDNIDVKQLVFRKDSRTRYYRSH